MYIPFLDLKKVNAPYHEAFNNQLTAFLNKGYYILGNSVTQFEKEFANYCNTEHCIGTGNGLDALTLILKGYIHLGKINLGDQILVAANTYIATIIAIENAGLTPVLIDADPHTLNLDSKLLPTTPEAAVKGILATHLYGRLADMETLRTYCDAHQLLLISDAAQAHGACNNLNQKAGSLADASGFSFYPTKNLGALGDAGAVTTNNSELAALISKLRNYGKSTPHLNEYLGINSRLDEIQAAFLSIKLQNLDRDNKKRQLIASRYCTEISNPLIKLPEITNFNNHVFHLFTVLVNQRSKFRDYLTRHGIGSAIHYPIPPHKQKPYLNYFKKEYTVTNTIANTIVSIPNNPTLTKNEVDYIIKIINAYSL